MLPIQNKKKEKESIYWWQIIPWNILFWSLFFFLLLNSFRYHYESISLYQERFGNKENRFVDIEQGDLVDVILIINGDELLVKKDNISIKVRMLGIKSFDPVISGKEITNFGRSSMNFLEHRILGKKAQLYFSSTKQDIYGRYLAYVYLDNIDINLYMIREGIAMVYTEYPTPKEAIYIEEEKIARASYRGIWGSEQAYKRIKNLRTKWYKNREDRKGREIKDPLISNENK